MLRLSRQQISEQPARSTYLADARSRPVSSAIAMDNMVRFGFNSLTDRYRAEVQGRIGVFVDHGSSSRPSTKDGALDSGVMILPIG